MSVTLRFEATDGKNVFGPIQVGKGITRLKKLSNHEPKTAAPGRRLTWSPQAAGETPLTSLH